MKKTTIERIAWYRKWMVILAILGSVFMAHTAFIAYNDGVANILPNLIAIVAIEYSVISMSTKVRYSKDLLTDDLGAEDYE